MIQNLKNKINSSQKLRISLIWEINISQGSDRIYLNNLNYNINKDNNVESKIDSKFLGFSGSDIYIFKKGSKLNKNFL